MTAGRRQAVCDAFTPVVLYMARDKLQAVNLFVNEVFLLGGAAPWV
jgi:hypothetical protein